MLKQLRLSTKLKALRQQLEAFIEKRDGFKKRETELSQSLEEATTQEDIDLINGEIESLENEVNEADCDGNITRIEDEIADIENELEEIGKPAPQPTTGEPEEKRNKEAIKMVRTRGIFAKFTQQRRAEILAADGVQEFLERAREFKARKQSVTGAELLIPETILGIVRENIGAYSKLINKVGFASVRGTSRIPIAGSFPEAIWTEMTGAINEMNIDFSAIEADGYKVAGFFAVPNSTLEDDAGELLAFMLEALSASIGIAIDKAIVFGTGKKMPLGFVSRLAQTEKPGDWSNDAPVWNDLHESNIKKYDLGALSGKEFFAALMEAFAIPTPKYNSADSKAIWVMNRKTHLDLIAKTIEFNSAAALVAQQNNTMPIVGGEIIELEFMADYDIAGGFGVQYKLIERGGSSINSSEHVKFIQEQTVMKVTARYDGMPVIAEAFILFNYRNIAPTTSAPFAADSANTDLVALKGLTIGDATLFPKAFDKDTLNYHCTVKAHSQKITAVALDSDATVTIKNGDTVVENESNATFKAGENILTITVTNAHATPRTYTVVVIDEAA